MKTRTGLLFIAMAIFSVAIVPILINQSADAASSCESTKGKSHAWYLGCKDGWFDHDHCYSYNGKSGDYAKGYAIGWAKGSC